ncbi:hypothetical protein PJ985_06665 [Streptomyces sp. ACA25]|uniref:hypothetical protein n=1 Tax=Streptomyces sp. ACA25 TaxID=3022596 RepID=UPI002306E851|nr:hypothetical protein [Streptomyces sp. ACA25]MDB1087248.1 hypothetical protein [Streptomyces sp. ACA25]
MTAVSSQGSPPPTPEGFEEEVHGLVNDTAPKTFAVVEEFTTEEGEWDARVVAWGWEHEDGTAQLTCVDGRRRMSLRSADRATWWMARLTGGAVRLVWVARRENVA